MAQDVPRSVESLARAQTLLTSSVASADFLRHLARSGKVWDAFRAVSESVDLESAAASFASDATLAVLITDSDYAKGRVPPTREDVMDNFKRIREACRTIVRELEILRRDGSCQLAYENITELGTPFARATSRINHDAMTSIAIGHLGDRVEKIATEFATKAASRPNRKGAKRTALMHRLCDLTLNTTSPTAKIPAKSRLVAELMTLTPFGLDEDAPTEATLSSASADVAAAEAAYMRKVKRLKAADR